ncbi:MAG TPA: TIGR01777 family oxidoreductase [Parafilimonas sp.]|nr:TIGR01777 family oxidoreductase [Parafilimonas sp.]
MATVLLTGGTGMIGTHLQKFLAEKGHTVIVLIRNESDIEPSADKNITYAKWDVQRGEIDKGAIAAADYLIHLAGANVAEKRWTDKRKKEIVESRTQSASLLVTSLQQIPNKVKAVISASAIGWYGPDTIQSKQHGFKEDAPPSNDFLGNTCKLWEESIQPVEALSKRLAIFRFGIVLSNDGGALSEFKKPLKFGVAAILGNGKQIISWIHIDDLCRLLLFAIEHENVSGIYNAVAPQTISNKSFTLLLAEKMRGKFYIPIHVPVFALKLRLGEMSVEVLKSATVSSEKISNTGFRFLYPSLQAALENLENNKANSR